MKILRYTLLVVLGFAYSLSSMAADSESQASAPDIIKRILGDNPKIPVDSTVTHNVLDDEMVIVDGDTISIILPQTNYGRYDRGLYNYLFIPRVGFRHWPDNTPSGYWVVPFGNPRIEGYLHLPAAYRSLSRPSSPPRAKASAMRPFVLSSFRLHG